MTIGNKIKSMIQKIPLGSKASIAFAFSSVVSTGISYLTTPVFTRLLSSQEYGQVSVYMAWKSVLAIIAMFSLQYGVFNNGMMDYEQDRDGFSFSLLKLSNLITLVISIVILSLYNILKTVISVDFKLIILMFIVFLFQPAYNFWFARQRYEYKYKQALVVSILISTITPIVSIVSVLLFKYNAVFARIASLECTLVIFYIIFYVRLGKESHWKVNRGYWKEAFLFNLPLLPHYLSTYILSSSDRIMISKLVNDSATGYYSIAYSIASIGLIIWTAVNGSLIPYTYEKCKKNKYNDISKVTKPILLILAFFCVFVILIAPEIMRFIATGEYFDSLEVVPVIVGGIFFQAHYSLFANVLYYYRKPKYVMYASVVAATLNIILNYIFIIKFGYIAAGYTTLICYIIQSTIDYVALRKICKYKIYDMKFIGILSLIIFFVAISGKYVYEHNLVRLILISTIGIICFAIRKKILDIFKLMKNSN